MGAEVEEGLLQQSMTQAMVRNHLSLEQATRLTGQQSFMAGAILEAQKEQDRSRLGRVEKDPEKLQQQIRSRSCQVGTDLGTALGLGVKTYGEENAVAVMASIMTATRAGMSVQAASGAVSALAESGYSLRETRQILQRTAERIRVERPEDCGQTAAQQIRAMTRNRVSAQEMLGRLGDTTGASGSGGKGSSGGGKGSGGGSGGGGNGNGGGGGNGNGGGGKQG